MPIHWTVDELLEAKGWSRYRLAIEAGITPSALYKLLGKKPVRHVDAATLDKLAGALGVRPLALLRDTKP